MLTDAQPNTATERLWRSLTRAVERLPKQTVASKSGTLDTQKCVNVIAKQQNIKPSGLYDQIR